MSNAVVRFLCVDPAGCCTGFAWVEEVRGIAGEANSLRLVTRAAQTSNVGEGAKAFEPRTGDGDAIQICEPEGSPGGLRGWSGAPLGGN